MVYKKYIKRDGKVFGPYYYESYRDENGDVKTRFISGPHHKDKVIKHIKLKSITFLFLTIAVLFVTLLFGNINYNANISGRVIDGSEVQYDGSLISQTETEIAERIAKNKEVSNVNLKETVGVKVRDSVLEKNKILKFNVPEGEITLDFDLLNYSEFIEKNVHNEIDAENFDINIQENPE